MVRKIGVAAVAGTLLVGSAGAQPVVAAKASARAKVKRLSPAQRHSFAVLRRARRASDVLPAALRRQALSDPLGRLYGTNLGLARQGEDATAAPGALDGIWVVPGNNAMCLYAALSDTSEGVGTSTCSASTAGAVAGRLLAVAGGFGGLSGSQVRIFGLMPDGVGRVAIFAAGGQRTVRVQRNVYTAVVDDPQQVRFSDSDGAHVVAVRG